MTAHLKVIPSGQGLSPSSPGCLGCSPMPSNSCLFVCFLMFIYLFWLRQVLVAAYGIFVAARRI